MNHWTGLPIVLMEWHIEEHQSKDKQVPYAIDASEKGTIHLDCDIDPLPMTFSHLMMKKLMSWWHRPT